MTSPTLTQAGQLARDLLAIRDRIEMMYAVADVCGLLADALDNTDAYTPLNDAASNAFAEALQMQRQRDEREAAQSRLGRLVDRMYRPEEA